MKQMFVLITLGIPLISLAQSEQIAGDYIYKSGTDSAYLRTYTLTLHSNGTFEFRFYQDQECYQETTWGKGTWRFETGIILFISGRADLTGKYNLNFQHTKAKLENKQLTFYDSRLSWLNNIILNKE